MQEMTMEEVEGLSGGARLTWAEGASMVAGVSMYSPATMAFGFPIAGAMLLLHLATN